MEERSLVLVVGPGRSGTSTLAGTLAMSGFHVPGAIKANETNPLGFFEPRWVVDMHKRVLGDAQIGTLDPSPRAPTVCSRRVRSNAVRAEIRERLQEWFAENPRLVVKDPRAIWVRDIWVAAARDVGVEPGFVMMLRHPSEVSASRGTYYEANAAAGVAGWINVALLTVQSTADARRAIVHYPDLLEDWRVQARRVADQLQIPLDPGPDVAPHPVDDFIDPSLRRVDKGWAELDVPSDLSDLAERVFGLLLVISRDEAPADVAEQLAALREEYDRLYAVFWAITRTEGRRATGNVRREATAKATAAAEQRRVVVRLRKRAKRILGR